VLDFEHDRPGTESERDTFLALILEGDRRRSEICARRVFELNGVPFLYERVVRPALEEVGRLWSAGRITVADEHLATAAAQSAVAALYPRYDWPMRGPRVIVACVEGERHDFGARMVADLFALDGWDDRFLGADVPVDDLAKHVQRIAPEVVALSVTLSTHLPAAKSAVEEVRRAVRGVKILVGGRATAVGAGVTEALEPDAVAHSGPEAVEVVRGWR
jgi:methanogenic corrinoid protein MtbC1